MAIVTCPFCAKPALLSMGSNYRPSNPWQEVQVATYRCETRGPLWRGGCVFQGRVFGLTNHGNKVWDRNWEKPAELKHRRRTATKGVRNPYQLPSTAEQVKRVGMIPAMASVRFYNGREKLRFAKKYK